MAQINLSFQTYESRAKPVSSQRLVNLYPEINDKNAKSQFSIYGTPGQILFSDVKEVSIYGMQFVNGSLYVVGGENLYKVFSDGSNIKIGSIGTTDGIVQMSSNGDYVIMLKPNGDMWVFNTSTLSLSQVTDVDYPGGSSVTFLSQYTIISRKDTGQIFWSALTNPTSWDSLDFATAEGSPDNIVGIINKNSEIWLFGESTIEIFYATGDSNNPFVRTNSAFLEKGCSSRNSIAKHDNFVFWLSDDKCIYRAQGYSMEKISNTGIDNTLYAMGTISDSIGFVYSQEGHSFYVITFPTEDRTFVYDLDLNLWHERQTGDSGRWCANCVCDAYDKVLIGDCDSGKILELDLNTYTDNGERIYRICTFPNLYMEDKRVIIDSLLIDMETGKASSEDEDPVIMLDWSDDGGFTFKNEIWKNIGNIGEYNKRVIWRRLGQTRQRVFRLTYSEPIKISIYGAYANVRPGRD